MRSVRGGGTALARQAIDASLECWACWREERHAVELAYQRWIDAGLLERRLAYAAYRASLDREEHAARTYADQCERVGQISARSRRSQPTIRATTSGHL